MKKRILLLLAAVLCICLCACGNEATQIKQESDDKITDNEIVNETRIEYVESDDDRQYHYKVYLSEEEFKECSSIVTLTMDNWSNYFEDYEYTQHIVEENEFGDKKERDVLVTGFGAKKGMVISVLEDVCFKIKADNADGYWIAKYEKQYGDDFIGTWLVDSTHYPMNNTGKMEDEVPLDVVGKILVFENLPLDISQIDNSKLTGELQRIELIVGKNTVWEYDLSRAFCRYYNEYVLE